MSHIATYKTSVVAPNAFFVKEALALAVEDFKGTLLEQGNVTDYAGRNPQLCTYVLTTPELRYGIGVNLHNGLEFVGDSYVRGWEATKNRILQHYGVLATRAAATDQGFTIAETKVQRNGDVQIELEVA